MPAQNDPIAAPSLSTVTLHGLFSGNARIGEKIYYAEALITSNGAVRLHVGDVSNVCCLTNYGGAVMPESDFSAQFVGDVRFSSGGMQGTGAVIGESCARTSPSSYCTAAADADIDLSARGTTTDPSFGNLAGVVSIASGGSETEWSLFLSRRSGDYYDLGIQAGSDGGYEELAGVFVENFADVAGSGLASISVNADGRVFLQADTTGCVANGQLTPYLDGSSWLFDVALNVSNCAGNYAYLNRNYGGLATLRAAYWYGWESWAIPDALVLLISSSDPDAAAVALTVVSEEVY